LRSLSPGTKSQDRRIMRRDSPQLENTQMRTFVMVLSHGHARVT
jgi:hypothetical protein